MNETESRAALITGASRGIGAVYADRLARRGFDLVLVARDRERTEAVANRLRAATGVTVDVVLADLTDPGGLAGVEARLREDERIGLLINNAGLGSFGSLGELDLDVQEALIRLNVIAVTRLTGAVVPRLLREGAGSIVNISSVSAFTPEASAAGFGIYPATKSFILALSQSLQAELGPRGIYVQAVLPASTRTEIWEHSNVPADAVPVMMDVNEMVDAALVGFDRREPVTIPSLPDMGQFEALEAARAAMKPNLRQLHCAARYRGRGWHDV
jgi:short-subunit dehydrogenase